MSRVRNKLKNMEVAKGKKKWKFSRWTEMSPGNFPKGILLFKRKPIRKRKSPTIIRNLAIYFSSYQKSYHPARIGIKDYEPTSAVIGRRISQKLIDKKGSNITQPPE